MVTHELATRQAIRIMVTFRLKIEVKLYWLSKNSTEPRCEASPVEVTEERTQSILYVNKLVGVIKVKVQEGQVNET